MMNSSLRLGLLALLLGSVRALQSQFILLKQSTRKHARSSTRCFADNGPINTTPSAANGEDPSKKKKCFDFKDQPVYTYASGQKKFNFRMDQTDALAESFSPMGRFRRCVSLPDQDVPDDEKTDVVKVLEALDENIPLEWDLARIARSAKRTRLLKERAYARPEPFETVNIPDPPGLKDLSPPEQKGLETFWITTTARLLSFFGSYFIFPFITRFLDHFVTMEPTALDEITSKFGPGISILYGTFISLTLSILYRRQQEIQDDVAIESSMLVFATRNLLSLFRQSPRLAEEAGQCSADQIRTLVKGSRGGELILLMYSDPYARMLELVDCYEERMIAEGKTDMGGRGALIGSCRDVIKDLFKQRANRLSNEALALPSTHFFILTILTTLILLSYSASTLPTVDQFGNPSNEASLIFGSLSSIYIVFYNFANDLNNPFSGVYQVRRSCTASHLLELKWLIANHPVLKGKINFEEGQAPDRYDEEIVMMRSPGLGNLLFDRGDIYPESNSDMPDGLMDDDGDR